MMFVFYFGVGSWVVTLSTYLMSAPVKGGLNFTTAEVGLIYSTFAFGGMLAPLAIGLLTDRLFRAERVLGVASLLSAGLIFSAGLWCDANFPKMDAAYRAGAEREVVAGRPALEHFTRLNGDGPAAADDDALREQVRHALDRVNDDPGVRRVAAEAFGPLFGLMLAYCVCMQLALTLTTVITLRNLPDPAHDFSRVRLFGTIGWIAAGVVLEGFFRPATTDVLYLGAAGAALVGVYAFTLPPTRPQGTGRSVAEAFGLPALRLFRDRSFVVFFLIAFVATGVNQFYVVYGHRYLTDHGVPKPALVMTLAQVVEVGCMFALPLLRPRDWMKPLMAVGLIGYTLRGLVMTVGWVPAVVALGVPMHGWGYTFFFLVAATYLDREAPPHLRGSAQGIITFVSGGLGVWAGNMFAGAVVDHYKVGTVIDWTPVWQVPFWVCAALVVAFLVLFKPPPDRGQGVGDGG
ncbi:MAG: putative nucleoside transporter YegT [Gemmataceae bacterium]|nr:putative nucleoside transporter YegT [Gemmataceae bacterium]